MLAGSPTRPHQLGVRMSIPKATTYTKKQCVKLTCATLFRGCKTLFGRAVRAGPCALDRLAAPAFMCQLPGGCLQPVCSQFSATQCTVMLLTHPRSSRTLIFRLLLTLLCVIACGSQQFVEQWSYESPQTQLARHFHHVPRSGL